MCGTNWASNVATAPGHGVLPVEALVGLALRRNPKRAHLLVSRVLAKHVPTEPGIVTAAGRLLALLVRRELQARSRRRRRSPESSRREQLRRRLGRPCSRPSSARPRRGLPRLLASGSRRRRRVRGSRQGDDADDGQEAREARLSAVAGLCELLEGQQTALPGAVTIGYAETATGLGQLVAGQLGHLLHPLHPARGGDDAVAAYGAFEEAHSHATSHQLLPTSRAALDLADTVILVDDELSTGATIVNTIRELHNTAPHRRYVIASLVDLRSGADRGMP